MLNTKMVPSAGPRRLVSMSVRVSIILLVLIAVVNVGAFNAAEQQALILPLPNAGESQLQGLATGSQVALEGRISAGTPSNARSLALYVRMEGSPLYGTFWKTLERGTPAFTLESGGGSVRIVNDSYTLDNERALQPDNYFGFMPGDQVTVLARVVHDERGAALSADEVIGGTWSDYLGRLRWSAWEPVVLTFLTLASMNLLLVLTLAWQQKPRRHILIYTP